MRNFEQLKEQTRKVLVITNRQQFFMVCTLIDHRNDVNVFKTLQWKHEPQASGFTVKFEILTLFLWSIRVQPMKNCCQFVFYHTIDSFDVNYRRIFLENCVCGKEKPNCVTITSFSWSVLLSNIALDHTEREKSFSYCKIQNCTRD